MNRLYQWFSRRASLSHSEKSGGGARRTIRTEVTVERESTTFLAAGSTGGLNACPLCGQTLSPDQAEETRLRLQQGSPR